MELLIVLGVLFLLISLALPFMNNAREEASRTQCLNHMRQVSQITRNYAEDHDGNINDNTGGFASRIEQVGPAMKDHVDVGPIFDSFVGGWDVPGSALSVKSTAFYCPSIADNVKVTLGHHADTVSRSPVLISYYKAGQAMASGNNGTQINVRSIDYLSEDSKKATWIERTVNHQDGANVVYSDGRGRYVNMEYDVALDPVNAFMSARRTEIK